MRTVQKTVNLYALTVDDLQPGIVFRQRGDDRLFLRIEMSVSNTDSVNAVELTRGYRVAFEPTRVVFVVNGAFVEGYGE